MESKVDVTSLLPYTIKGMSRVTFQRLSMLNLNSSRVRPGGSDDTRSRVESLYIEGMHKDGLGPLS